MKRRTKWPLLLVGIVFVGVVATVGIVGANTAGKWIGDVVRGWIGSDSATFTEQEVQAAENAVIRATLAASAEAVNKDLPKLVGDDVIFDEVAYDGGMTLIYRFVKIRRHAGEFDATRFRQSWLKSFALPACGNESARFLLGRGADIQYFFRDEGGTHLGFYVLNEALCRAPSLPAPSEPTSGGAETQVPRDSSYSSWLKACERIQAALGATERARSIDDTGVACAEPSLNGDDPLMRKYLGPPITAAEQEAGNQNQYEKDATQAAQRGVSLDTILAERMTQEVRDRREADRQAEEHRAAEYAKAESRELAIIVGISVGAAAITIAAVVAVFKVRRRVAETWRKSKALRVWAFGSLFWAVGTLLFVAVFEPYESGGWLSYGFDETGHMLSVMIIPSLFFGALWFGYKRFVS